MLTGNAYLVAGTTESIPAVLALLEKQGIPTHANPDVYVRTYTHFGVDEARELRERAYMRALQHAQCKRRAFVVASPGMTTEAQNALLKTLEEPPADAVFFFIVPSPDSLLATIRSR